MPRPPRIDFPDAVYHVTSRGNGRARIFFDDADRSRFIRQLCHNLQTHAIILYAYVLMDNHFHILARTPRANLSRFMQQLNTSYALYARYKHRKPGHQFEGRFKAKLIQEESYMLAVTRYIHVNPIKTTACRELTWQERIQRIEAHSWSSYPGYIAKKNAEDFICYDVLKEYGSNMISARRLYRAYVDTSLMEDDRLICDAMCASRYAIGDESFIKATEKRLQKHRKGTAQDKDLDLPIVTVPIETIDAYVSEHFQIDPGKLFEHGHRAGKAKYLAVELACRLAGLTNRDVGAHYGGISSAAVSIIRRNVREGKYEISQVMKQLLTKIHRNEAGE